MGGQMHRGGPITSVSC